MKWARKFPRASTFRAISYSGRADAARFLVRFNAISGPAGMALASILTGQLPGGAFTTVFPERITNRGSNNGVCMYDDSTASSVASTADKVS